MNTTKHSTTASDAPEAPKDDQPHGGESNDFGVADYHPEPRIYRIIRFRFNGKPRTVRNNVTLTEAQNHCSREDTSSHSTGSGAWFDGYDYMKGCKPRE